MQYKPVLSCNKGIREIMCLYVCEQCVFCDQVYEDVFDKNHHVNDFRSSSFARMMSVQRLAACVREKTRDCLDRTLTFLIVCHNSSLLTTSCLAKTSDD